MSDSLVHEIQVLRASFWSRRDPEGRAFASLADAYRRNGELEEAESLVQEGLRRHPDFATGHLIAAWVFRDKGDHVLVRQHLDRMLDLDPGNVLGLVERAASAAAEGDRDGAVGDLRRVLGADPSHPEARQRLEALELGSGWVADAPDIEEPELPRSDGSIVTRTMGELYARQGFRDRAAEVFEALVEREPENESLVERLAELRSPSDDEGNSPPAALEGDADVIESTAVAVEEEASTKGAPDDASGTISAYFDDLLAWVPGAVPIASLAPGSVPVLSEAGPSASDGPTAVPDELDIETQARDAEALTPGEEPLEAKTPDETSQEGMDDFNRWLRSLQS